MVVPLPEDGIDLPTQRVCTENGVCRGEERAPPKMDRWTFESVYREWMSSEFMLFMRMVPWFGAPRDFASGPE
jgi:hypothetical protein